MKTITPETTDQIASLLADATRLIIALDERRDVPASSPEFKTRVDAVWRAHATARDSFSKCGLINK